MIGYSNVDEQIDSDFRHALRKAFVHRWRDRLRTDPPHDHLLSFDEAKSALARWSQSYRGIRSVEVEKIKGSVGRYRDFDEFFLPLKQSMGARWRRIDRAYHRGEELPAISLYKIGEAYFVRDGNHRVSVARYHGVEEIDAEVVELRSAEARQTAPRAPSSPARRPHPPPEPGASSLHNLRKRLRRGLLRPGDRRAARSTVTKEEQGMYRGAVRHCLSLVFLVGLLVFPASACGGDEEESKGSPLPEEQQALRPGEYSSEEFEPSLSFEVGEGWTVSPPEVSDHLGLTREGTAGLIFANIQEVYEPTQAGTPNVVDAPEDMVSWFRQHPQLRTEEPEPVTVGGVEGVGFDVVVGDLPEDHHNVCGPGCVDVFRTSGGSALGLRKGEVNHVIILEDVNGETVTMGFGSLASEFEEFAPEAKKVLESVEWRDV